MAAPSIQYPTDSVVAVFGAHSAAESAVKTLMQHAFDIKTLSVVGRDFGTEKSVTGFYALGTRMRYWGKLGTFWEGLWGLLVGAAFMIIPSIGPVLIAGPAAAWVVAALEGAVVIRGLSTLGSALVTFGIPKEQAMIYESFVKAGKFLLIAHGNQEDVARASAFLKDQPTESVETHSVSPEPAAVV